MIGAINKHVKGDVFTARTLLSVIDWPFPAQGPQAKGYPERSE
jgi:hypothetical protein